MAVMPYKNKLAITVNSTSAALLGEYEKVDNTVGSRTRVQINFIPKEYRVLTP